MNIICDVTELARKVGVLRQRCLIRNGHRPGVVAQVGAALKPLVTAA